MSEGRVVEDIRQDDEEEMAALREAREAEGDASLTTRRHHYLESLAHPAPDPYLEAEIEAAAVPPPTAGRLVVEGDDQLEGPDSPWSHSNPQKEAAAHEATG